MQWIKATKRLPELNKEISFRIYERRYAGKMIEEGIFQHNGFACTYGAGSVEWLDESQPIEGDVREAAEGYSKTEWKHVDSGLPVIDEIKYNAFLAGAAYRDKQGTDEYNQINLYPVTIKPKKHGKYWCLLEPKPINYGYNLCQLEYGIGFDGKEGFLQENDSFTPTHWFEFNFLPTPITSDIVEQLEKEIRLIVIDTLNLYCGETIPTKSFTIISKEVAKEALSKLRELLSSQPSQGSVQILIDALNKIANPIKHMREDLKEGEQLHGQYAIQLSNDPEYLKSIAREAFQKFNSGNQTEKGVLENLLAELHKKEVFFRLENNDDGFFLSIIDRSIFPRIWADNMKDGVEILAESTDHLINRTTIGDKDWKERFYGDSVEELLKKYTLIKKP